MRAIFVFNDKNYLSSEFRIIIALLQPAILHTKLFVGLVYATRSKEQRRRLLSSKPIKQPILFSFGPVLPFSFPSDAFPFISLVAFLFFDTTRSFRYIRLGIGTFSASSSSSSSSAANACFFLGLVVPHSPIPSSSLMGSISIEEVGHAVGSPMAYVLGDWKGLQ